MWQTLYQHQYLTNICTPQLSLPSIVRSLDPLWATCSNNLFGAFDPPIALTLQAGLTTPKSTSAQTTTPGGGNPAPQSSAPPVNGPTPTPPAPPQTPQPQTTNAPSTANTPSLKGASSVNMSPAGGSPLSINSGRNAWSIAWRRRNHHCAVSGRKRPNGNREPARKLGDRNSDLKNKLARKYCDRNSDTDRRWPSHHDIWNYDLARTRDNKDCKWRDLNYYALGKRSSVIRWRNNGTG